MSIQKKVIRLVLLPLAIIIFNIIYLIKAVLLSLVSLIYQSDIPVVVRTPESRFQGLDALGYTFKPNYVELPVGGGITLPRMHYVDEGPRDAKETVLCLHGEPSWSFLYRRLVPGLVGAGYRVIVPDFIGFGKSDKFTHPEAYSHAQHTMSLRLLLDHLKVSQLTLVCQDWGGLTGLSVVKDCPQLFSRLVIMNTGLPSGEDFKLTKLDKMTPFLTWQAFARMTGAAIPIKFIFRLAMKTVSDQVLAAYEAPFPSSLYKAGAARWPLLVPLSHNSLVSSDMRAAKDFLKTQWSGPALIMFSDNDPITGTQVHSFRKMLPDAKQITIHGGRHFLQEEKGEELAVNIVKFISGKL